MRRNARRVPTAQRVRTFYRLFRKLVKWTRPLLAAALLFLVARYSWMLFSTSDMFSLKQVEYSTHHPVSKAALLKFAKVKLGANLLAMDLQTLGQRITAHPRIKSVHLRRKLPHTLAINIKAHKPVAIAVMGHRYLLNATGVPFAKVTRKHKDLLVIAGVNRAEYESNPKATQLLFREALSLGKQYKQRKLDKYQPLQEILYNRVLGYTLRTPTGKIHLGDNSFPKRMENLAKIYKIFWGRGIRQLKEVYLYSKRHPNRIHVRLGDAVLVQPSPIPKPPKPRKPALH